jgi:glyoxylase-like metal-dependent hydrolase (beta-lactamase superfamily II)
VLNVERVALAYNNVYLVDDGSDLVVIDAGPDYRGARETILAALRGRKPALVLATHGHLDHAGLGAWWQDQGVPVSLGAEDDAYARGEDFEFMALANYVRECAAPPSVVAEAVEGLRIRREWHDRLRHAEGWAPSRDGRWPTQLRYAPFAPSELVEGERKLPCGLRVVPAPGHTPGNVVVIGQGEAGPVLFSGDQLLPEITPTPAIQFHRGERFPSLPRFIESLTHLASAEMRFVACYPGHGDPFRNVAEVLAANLAQAKERTGRVLEALDTEGPGSVYEIAERLYPRALRRRFWQIIATTQGHLDVLAESGAAIFEGRTWRAI